MSSKLQNTGMETMAIIVVLVITCLTIKAQGAKIDNSELNRTTLALTEPSKKVISAETEKGANATFSAFTAYLIEENEAQLETEEWMLNVDNFFMEYNLEEATEAPLELESWMTDAGYFGISAYLETETEETLNVEEWMLNMDNFYLEINLEEETEEALKTELWMVSYTNWDRK